MDDQNLAEDTALAEDEAALNRADDARAGRRMAFGAIIISFFLFLGKISGYVRSMLMSGWFGGDERTDAFYKIYDIVIYGTYTNFEKILRPAYLPQFVRERKAGGDEHAWKLTSVIANLEILVLVVLCAILEIFAPQIIRFSWRNLAADPYAFSVATTLLRVMAPTAVVLSLSLIPELTLHAYKRFTLPAIAEFLFRVMLVGGLIMGAFILKDPTHPKPIMAAALGVILGGSLRFLGMIPGLWSRLKYYRPILNPAKVPGGMIVLHLMPPIVVGMVTAYARGYADTVYTDIVGPGMYTYLKYGRQMGDAALQILPLAISFVVYPFLSEWAARGEKDKLADALVSMTRIMAFIFVPLAVINMFMSRPIISIMFEHGELSSEGARFSAIALFCYAPGLLFFALEGSINKWYFALQDTKTPNYWGAAMAVLNIIIGYIGVVVLFQNNKISEAAALAVISLALTISKSLKVVILYGLIRRKIGTIDLRQALMFAIKLAIATVLLAAATYYIIQFLEVPLASWQPSFLHKPSLVNKLRQLALWAAVVAGGGLVFLTAAAALRLEELQTIGGYLREKIGKRLKR
ncbi:MAG: murein biosynthesis integral membrane protein MurJ [Bacteroidota bacterium]